MTFPGVSSNDLTVPVVLALRLHCPPPISAFQAFSHTVQHMTEKLGSRSTQPRRNQPRKTCHAFSRAAKKFLSFFPRASCAALYLLSHAPLRSSIHLRSRTILQIRRRKFQICPDLRRPNTHALPRAAPSCCFSLKRFTHCAGHHAPQPSAVFRSGHRHPDQRLPIYSSASSTLPEDPGRASTCDGRISV